MSRLLPAGLMTGLRRRYGEPQRHYHTWAHIEALLLLFEEVRDRLFDDQAVEIALYYHDAIYDPEADDNEHRSAALLRRDCEGLLAADSLARAAQLVEATAGHWLPEGFTGAALEDARLFLDMDLSILATPWPVFCAYEAAIRAEYGHVENREFRLGRRRLLETFLKRDRLYLSDHFAPRFEAAARDNLKRSLARLV